MLYSVLMKLLNYILITIFSLFLAGCVEYPEQRQTLGYNGAVSLAGDNSICENRLAVAPAGGNVFTGGALNADRISLLSWNSYKGTKEGWLDTFSELSKSCDIITLQEGYATDQLSQTLQSNQFTWDLAAAFKLDDTSAGVLTASKVAPDGLCSFWDVEPILTVPKTSMVTRYKLNGSTESLLLVNIHMVNFTMGTSSFIKQLSKVETFIKEHRGPVILAGDFNTWSSKRLHILNRTVSSLELKPVTFTNENRTKFMGEIVDHIYYRGLELVDAESISVEVSDHNPLLATFSLKASQNRKQG